MFSRAEIDALPTILDVVEKTSARENSFILPHVSTVPSSSFFDEGRFIFVSDEHNRNIVHLMPTSQSPYVFYRGQSRYHAPCIPSLYRGPKDGETASEEDIAYHRIKICEFALLLETHPVFQEVSRNTFVNYVAMAQHYGLTTEYLDITNSKWVAAFFAATGHDSDTDTYYPVGKEYHEGYGVMYISKEWDMEHFPQEFFDKNGVIGYQYFDRPTKQSSFGYKMIPGEDFNSSPYFEKVFFRHDLEASTVIFNMSYRQERFIPKDTLSKLAKEIAESKEVTRNAHFMCWKNFYQDKGAAFLDRVCASKGLAIREDNRPVAQFSKEELEKDWKEWNEYGRDEIQSRILPIRPILALDYPA